MPETAEAGSGTPTDEFDYELPEAAIAQEPLAERSQSRMLELRGSGQLRDRRVSELPELLRAGDCLVVNDTRVRAARLRGLVGGRSGEVLLLSELSPCRFLALVRPARCLVSGDRLSGAGWRVVVEESWPGHPGGRVVRFEGDQGLEPEQAGEVPLPPYLRRRLADPGRYQTVYARGPAVSAAAPTAGLHLTEELLGRMRTAGVELIRIQLEVGLATFQPIRARTIEAHRMHPERYRVSPEAARRLSRARARGGRVVAVGTTVVRCLESRAGGQGGILAGEGETELYLRPGSRFQVVDGLLTNFHQPRSSLLVLVSGFFGGAAVGHAYREALRRGYRFLSFGDCMFGWRAP